MGVKDVGSLKIARDAFDIVSRVAIVRDQGVASADASCEEGLCSALCCCDAALCRTKRTVADDEDQ